MGIPALVSAAARSADAGRVVKKKSTAAFGFTGELSGTEIRGEMRPADTDWQGKWKYWRTRTCIPGHAGPYIVYMPERTLDKYSVQHWDHRDGWSNDYGITHWAHIPTPPWEDK